jgi:hypothetical protein
MNEFDDLDWKLISSLLGKKIPTTNKMTREEWDMALKKVWDIILSHSPMAHRNITDDDIGDRNSPKSFALRCCQMLPWFHQKQVRFRQTLPRGFTRRQLVQAMNFLFRTNFRAPGNEALLVKLQRCFHEMKIPPLSHCLSTIIVISRKVQSPVLPALVPAPGGVGDPLVAPLPGPVTRKRPAADSLAAGVPQQRAKVIHLENIADYERALISAPDPVTAAQYRHWINEHKEAIRSLEALAEEERET